MQNFEIFHFIRVPSCQEAILTGKRWKNYLRTSFFKFFKVFHHQMGRIKVSGAVEQWFGCRILRSFICDGSRGLILSKNNDFFQKLSNFGVFWESKIGKKVKCLMKWVRLAPNELKLCRNDQARIGTSKMLVLANISQFFRGKNRFFFFWPFSGSTGPPISPY